MRQLAQSNVVIAAGVAPAAYVRDRKDAKDGRVVYQYVTDQECILNAPPDDVIFVDGMIKDYHSTIQTLQARHPCSHPLLSSASHTHVYHGQKYPDKVWFTTKQERYTGQDYDEVCRVARETGEPIRVQDSYFFRNSHYDADHGKYMRHEQELNARGCYLRERTMDDVYVVYGPAVAARRLARFKKGIPPRDCRYVTCAELMAWCKAMYKCNNEAVSNDICGHYPYEWRRWAVLQEIRKAISLFELLYGRNASWQLDEFRELVKLWKRKRAATLDVFHQSVSNHRVRDLTLVFDILDEAAKRDHPPRRRKLRCRLPKDYRWKCDSNS